MTILPFDSPEEQLELHKKVCKCGHTLTMHAFTMHHDELLKCSVYWPSQCISCDCKIFQEGKND